MQYILDNIGAVKAIMATGNIRAAIYSSSIHTVAPSQGATVIIGVGLLFKYHRKKYINEIYKILFDTNNAIPI